MSYEPVIGLEVHVQLKTETKMFCSCSTSFGANQNSQVCPVCLGLPGVLPVPNRCAVEYAVRMALATNCRVANCSIFARKNYFYPDLPKGYQISQYEQPLCDNGVVEFEMDGQIRRVGLTRIHLEEDAGKSIHDEEFVGSDESLVDVNRCGMPLIEIVSDPDITSPGEAAAFLLQIRKLVQYLGISTGNMEEGSLRCDANVSVRPAGSVKLGVKTELKNMNSVRSVERALAFEIERQTGLLEEGERVQQETLLWDTDKQEAVSMRSKEFDHDYRYFPDPDLLPLDVSDEWQEAIRASLPELPLAREKRLVSDYGLPEYDASVLTDTRELADYFESVARASGSPKKTSNWIMGDVLRVLNEQKIGISEFTVKPDELAALIRSIEEGQITGKIAKDVFADMVKTGKNPQTIIQEKGLTQISDSTQLVAIVKQVLQDNPDEVEKFLGGKEQVLGFLVGQVMKATRGQANPGLVQQLLREELSSE